MDIQPQMIAGVESTYRKMIEVGRERPIHSTS
jgi:hypothetical protein